MLQYDFQRGEFVPGTLPADGSKISILYARLAYKNAQAGKSQLEFLLHYALDHQLPNPRFFFDDGYSGTNFDRPDFQEAMEIVEAGLAAIFAVKDHSRFGRDKFQTRTLIERLTKKYGVRYIAISDNIDSDKPGQLLFIHA